MSRIEYSEYLWLGAKYSKSGWQNAWNSVLLSQKIGDRFPRDSNKEYFPDWEDESPGDMSLVRDPVKESYLIQRFILDDR